MHSGLRPGLALTTWTCCRRPRLLRPAATHATPRRDFGRPLCSSALDSASRFVASSFNVSPQRTLDSAPVLGTWLLRIATHPPDMSRICHPGNWLITCCKVMGTAALLRSASRKGETSADLRNGGRRGARPEQVRWRDARRRRPVAVLRPSLYATSTAHRRTRRPVRPRRTTAPGRSHRERQTRSPGDPIRAEAVRPRSARSHDRSRHRRRRLLACHRR